MYKVIISLRAQEEIEVALDYYIMKSINTPAKFISALKATYEKLTINPFRVVR